MPKLLPESVERRLWKLKRPDPANVYSAGRVSPTRVEVRENGRKVLHRETVQRDAPGEFVVERGWLIHRTYPRATEAYRREQEAKARAEEIEAAKLAIAAAAPEYVAFVKRLRRELGRSRQARACDQRHLAFRAPDLRRCTALIAEAHSIGAAATLFLAGWGRELRVVPDRVDRFTGLWGWSCHGDGELSAAFAALDEDAGLTLEYVADQDYFAPQFALLLDRVPKRRAQHAAALGRALDTHVGTVSTALRGKRWAVGPPPTVWKKVVNWIIDPGTDNRDFDRDA